MLTLLFRRYIFDTKNKVKSMFEGLFQNIKEMELFTPPIRYWDLF